MSILKAYCIHCASEAGDNGFECDWCADLPHVEAFSRVYFDSVEFLSECPHCKRANQNASWDGRILCVSCMTEYVCNNPEDDGLERTDEGLILEECSNCHEIKPWNYGISRKTKEHVCDECESKLV